MNNNLTNIEHSEYYDLCRRDILKQVPANCRHILSVGCGAGRTELELIKNGVSVTGIEMDALAAKIARHRGIHVLEGDVAELCSSLTDTYFDCVIFADVLEHIMDADIVVKTIAEKIRPGGTIIVSVPNFRYYKFLYDIVFRGGITYASAGIYDRTHIRITTAKMVEDWFHNSGLIPKSRNYNLGGRRHRWLSAMTGNLFRCFFAFQVIAVGVKP